MLLLNKDIAGRTSKEADKVSRETRLSSKGAGREGWWRGKGRRGEEEKEGVETPSSHENLFSKTMGFRRENRENGFRSTFVIHMSEWIDRPHLVFDSFE
jgi:hypothetical protein